MRRQHYLTSVKTATYPTRCIWYDTETTPEKVNDDEERHRLDFGWAVYRRNLGDAGWSRPEWFRFTDPDTFWNWVESKCKAKTTTWMFAHNAAYDATVTECWRILPERGWDLSNAVIDSPPFIAFWKRDKASLKMLDTLNYWKVPLKMIGEVIGLPKFDFPSDWKDRKTANRYCKRDIEIIMEALIQWWDWLADNGLGGAAPTIASQAMTAYRYRFLKHAIFIDDNVSALQLARDAYHGGRVEVFKVGKTRGPLYMLDVRSEYPSVMRNEEYPTVLRGIYRNIDIASLSDLLNSHAVVARVEIETDIPAYPFSDSSPLLFPVGHFTTSLTSGELIYAIEHDHIVAASHVVVYYRAPIFKEYVEELIGLRFDALERGDPFESWILKRLLNALYGKFGQRGHKSERMGTTTDMGVKLWSEVDGETGERYRMRQLAGVIERHWTEGESATSHPAIAAHVTGHGRMLLWSLITRAGPRNVFYCDTDSLLVNAKGYKRLEDLISVDELGALHLEKIVEHAELRAPKDYALDDVSKTKGVRSNAVWLDENTVLQEKWLGLRSLMMRGDLSTPVVRQEIKRLSRRYDKGVVASDGWVRPYRLPEEAGSWLR